MSIHPKRSTTHRSSGAGVRRDSRLGSTYRDRIEQHTALRWGDIPDSRKKTAQRVAAELFDDLSKGQHSDSHTGCLSCFVFSRPGCAYRIPQRRGAIHITLVEENPILNWIPGRGIPTRQRKMNEEARVPDGNPVPLRHYPTNFSISERRAPAVVATMLLRKMTSLTPFFVTKSVRVPS